MAGGAGTRLHPATIAFSKQLIPVYDKPMVYYPLSTLLSIGIREILIIVTSRDMSMFKSLLGDGSHLGCKFSYKIVDIPVGIPIAFIVGEKFIGRGSVAMVLGDNLFYGTYLDKQLEKYTNVNGAMGFATYVEDPKRYGVYEFDKNMNVVSIEEKPEHPKSNYANSGLYFFDNDVVEISKGIKPSARGELEITSVLNVYLQKKKLKVCLLKKGTYWLDMGTYDSIKKASDYIRKVEKKREYKIGCIEEVSYRKGYINKEQLRKLAEKLIKSEYGKYLVNLI